MRKRTAGVIAILACLVVWAPALAQYGHPLKGTWSGDWGPNAATRNRVLLHLDWDGKAITGSINPGSPNAITLTRVTAEPVQPTFDAWNVRMEGNGVVVEGKVVNLGSYERTMSGTWTEKGQKGDFKLTRN
ncbi:MAG TPA: hypothetical protein VM818_13595 [Vicinamibacterales bacterium]|nr:hypothetical protein [Vicinamibacterales bacterium]